MANIGIDSDIATLHAEVDRGAGRLHLLHAERLHCRQGCSSCCVDDLSVFDVEAEIIRSRHAELLQTGIAHPAGGCAFLDENDACRVYADRPYVCRTQGLPLRWIDDEEPADVVERRDICPLNEEGEPIELLPEADCWTLGPMEDRLARLQIATTKDSGLLRISLRSLFAPK